ncbi:hypothetical protein M0804_006732 [Polistes exclamans]|nr:hypothetical protein M0804_006732 [Polistes exclamans]
MKSSISDGNDTTKRWRDQTVIQGRAKKSVDRVLAISSRSSVYADLKADNDDVFCRLTAKSHDQTTTGSSVTRKPSRTDYTRPEPKAKSEEPRTKEKDEKNRRRRRRRRRIGEPRESERERKGRNMGQGARGKEGERARDRSRGIARVRKMKRSFDGGSDGGGGGGYGGGKIFRRSTPRAAAG